RGRHGAGGDVVAGGLFLERHAAARGELEPLGGAPGAVDEHVGGVELGGGEIVIGVQRFQRGAGECGERREGRHGGEGREAGGQICLRRKGRHHWHGDVDQRGGETGGQEAVA